MTDQPAPERAPTDNPEPAAQPAPPALTAYTPPPVPPPAMPQPAMPQPAVSWAPAPATAASGGRTPLAAAAGIVVLVLGIGFGLLGLLTAVLGSTVIASLGDLPVIPELEGADTGTVLAGVVAFFGILVVIYSLVYVVAGIGILRSRGWGRTIGLIVGILSGLIWLSGVVNAGDYANARNGGGLVFALVMLIAHVYVVVALAAFWRTKASTA